MRPRWIFKAGWISGLAPIFESFSPKGFTYAFVLIAGLHSLVQAQSEPVRLPRFPSGPVPDQGELVRISAADNPIGKLTLRGFQGDQLLATTFTQTGNVGYNINIQDFSIAPASNQPVDWSSPYPSVLFEDIPIRWTTSGENILIEDTQTGEVLATHPKTLVPLGLESNYVADRHGVVFFYPQSIFACGPRGENPRFITIPEASSTYSYQRAASATLIAKQYPGFGAQQSRIEVYRRDTLERFHTISNSVGDGITFTSQGLVTCDEQRVFIYRFSDFLRIGLIHGSDFGFSNITSIMGRESYLWVSGTTTSRIPATARLRLTPNHFSGSAKMEGFRATEHFGPRISGYSKAFFTENTCFYLDQYSNLWRWTVPEIEAEAKVQAGPGVLEGEAVQVVVSLSRPLPYTFQATLRAEDGTAQGGLDYQASDLPISIPAGQTTLNLEIPTITDSNIEGPEAFRLRIVNQPASVAVGKPAECIVRGSGLGFAYCTRQIPGQARTVVSTFYSDGEISVVEDSSSNGSREYALIKQGAVPTRIKINGMIPTSPREVISTNTHIYLHQPGFLAAVNLNNGTSTRIDPPFGTIIGILPDSLVIAKDGNRLCVFDPSSGQIVAQTTTSGDVYVPRIVESHPSVPPGIWVVSYIETNVSPWNGLYRFSILSPSTLLPIMEFEWLPEEGGGKLIPLAQLGSKIVVLSHGLGLRSVDLITSETQWTAIGAIFPNFVTPISFGVSGNILAINSWIRNVASAGTDAGWATAFFDLTTGALLDYIDKWPYSGQATSVIQTPTGWSVRSGADTTVVFARPQHPVWVTDPVVFYDNQSIQRSFRMAESGTGVMTGEIRYHPRTFAELANESSAPLANVPGQLQLGPSPTPFSFSTKLPGPFALSYRYHVVREGWPRRELAAFDAVIQSHVTSVRSTNFAANAPQRNTTPGVMKLSAGLLAVSYPDEPVGEATGVVDLYDVRTRTYLRTIQPTSNTARKFGKCIALTHQHVVVSHEIAGLFVSGEVLVFSRSTGAWVATLSKPFGAAGFGSRLAANRKWIGVTSSSNHPFTDHRITVYDTSNFTQRLTKTYPSAIPEVAFRGDELVAGIWFPSSSPFNQSRDMEFYSLPFGNLTRRVSSSSVGISNTSSTLLGETLAANDRIAVAGNVLANDENSYGVIGHQPALSSPSQFFNMIGDSTGPAGVHVAGDVVFTAKNLLRFYRFGSRRPYASLNLSPNLQGNLVCTDGDILIWWSGGLKSAPFPVPPVGDRNKDGTIDSYDWMQAGSNLAHGRDQFLRVRGSLLSSSGIELELRPPAVGWRGIIQQSVDLKQWSEIGSWNPDAGRWIIQGLTLPPSAGGTTAWRPPATEGGGGFYRYRAEWND